MAQQDRIVMRSRLLSSVLGAVSLGFLSGLIGLAVNDITKSKTIPRLEAPAILAAIFNTSSLVSVLVLILLCWLYRRPGWLQSVVLPLAGFLFAVVGACLSLSTFLIQKANRGMLSSQVSFGAEMGVWIVSIAVQIAFYIALVFGRFTSDDCSSTESFNGAKRTAPERPPTPPTPLRIVAPPYALPQARASPTFPLEPSSKRSSWRDSLASIQNAVLPSVSRQKLLGPRLSVSRSSSNSGFSEARSAATTVQSDAFDAWDTSSLDQQIKETIHLAVPTKGTALEPIPGSRPVSPAKTLDGLFSMSQQQLHSQEQLSERPPTALSILSQLQRPPTAFSVVSAQRAGTPTRRPSDPQMSESHIHPLFRTDSPVPPPTTTPGTVVTASPFSSHVIRAPSRASSRTRLNEQGVSPVIGSRAGSVDDLPLRTSRSRSSSTTRAMTPPIPEFILSANREKPL